MLKRVEVVEDEVVDPEALHLKAKPMDRIPSGDKGGLKRWKEQAVDEVLHLKVLQAINAREHRPKAESMKAKSNGAKENGVNDSSEDKRFKLIPGVLDMGKIKRIQANGHEGSDKPSTKVSGSVGSMPTLVLATGDAKGGQFNSDGFLGAVREALLRGWRVELFSFKAGQCRVSEFVSPLRYCRLVSHLVHYRQGRRLVPRRTLHHLPTRRVGRAARRSR